MTKILVLCVTLGVLVVIAESKRSGFPQRARAPEIIDSVTGLLRNGIMLPTWNGIVQVNKDKMNARRKTYIIGPGRRNNNRVMINDNNGDYFIGPGRGNKNRVMFKKNNDDYFDDDYFDDYNRRNFNYRSRQRSYNSY